MSWSKDLIKLGPVILALVFGFGISLYIGGQFYASLPAGTAANAVNQVVAGIYNGLVTFFPIIVTVIFLVILYKVVEGSGLLKMKE